VELKEDDREEVAAEGNSWREVKEIPRKSAGVTSWTPCASKVDEQNNDLLYVLLEVSTVYLET
jgi:hypothetical protein